MGRKQKLRQERKIKYKNPTSAVVTTTSEATVEAASEVIPPVAAMTEIEEEIDNVFPKSDEYVQATVENQIYNGNEQYALVKQGATEHGCVHSMLFMGRILANFSDGRRMHVHLALPWFLEGAIRGSVQCILTLIGEYYFDQAEPNRNADLLKEYWGKIASNTDTRLPNLAALNGLKHQIGRKCIICSKTDTNTLPLKQCIGCSFHCYCSETCQTIHWKEHKHRNECKQLRILNKYHKPYFNEIRDAVIRGDKEIPSLEKLRYKLGLTRPLEDYQELIDYNTHDGKLINPKDYFVAREDGTVWVAAVEAEC